MGASNKKSFALVYLQHLTNQDCRSHWTRTTVNNLKTRPEGPRDAEYTYIYGLGEIHDMTASHQGFTHRTLSCIHHVRGNQWISDSTSLMRCLAARRFGRESVVQASASTVVSGRHAGGSHHLCQHGQQTPAQSKYTIGAHNIYSP